jgi:hypothetical protein
MLLSLSMEDLIIMSEEPRSQDHHDIVSWLKVVLCAVLCYRICLVMYTPSLLAI